MGSKCLPGHRVNSKIKKCSLGANDEQWTADIERSPRLQRCYTDSRLQQKTKCLQKFIE